jgi:hypothetical protein
MHMASFGQGGWSDCSPSPLSPSHWPEVRAQDCRAGSGCEHTRIRSLALANAPGTRHIGARRSLGAPN